MLSLLKTANWKLATCSNNYVTTVPNKVTQTDGERDEDGVLIKPPSFTSYLDDRYDAFKQGGDADVTTATFCGYAGLVAYRFTLPSDYSSTIEKITLKFSTARYLRSGLRVSVVLSNSVEPSDEWDVIRGDAQSTTSNVIVCSPHEESEADGVASWGLLSQDVPTLMDSRASEGDFIIASSDFPQIATSEKFQYMWVYVSIEDYTDYWTYYNATEPRYYSIEGSATLVPSRCSISFSGSEEKPTYEHTLDIVKDGVLPSVYPDDEGSQIHQVTVQRNGDPIPSGNLNQIVKDIELNGGVVNNIQVCPPLGNDYYDGIYQWACICGRGFEGTFKNIPGLLLYDCEQQKLVQYTGIEVPMYEESKEFLEDDDHYGIVNCLMNYENAEGFFILPCVGRHITETSIHHVYYDILDHQVDGVYASGDGDEFIYFNYDKANCKLTNVRKQEHKQCRLQGISQLYRNRLIALPGMVTHTLNDKIRDCLWVGVKSGNQNNTDNYMIVTSLLMTNTDIYTPQYYHNIHFVFSAMRHAEYTGRLKEIIPVPVEAYRPYPYRGIYDYKAGAGVVVVDGEVAFVGSEIYDDHNEIPYTSTLGCDRTVKIIVNYKSDTTAVSQNHLCLDSSFEKSGVKLTKNAMVNHTYWSVKNNNVIAPTGNEWIASGLEETKQVVDEKGETITVVEKLQPVKVLNDFTPITTSYGEDVRCLSEFANDTSIWSYPSKVGDMVKKGYFITINDYDLNSSAEGLRVCYGKFFTGQSTKVSGLEKRIGASFSLNSNTTVGLHINSPIAYSTQTINCWQIAQSSLVVPFACPRTWKATQVKLDWSRWTGTATQGTKIFVWLMRENFIETHPQFLGKVQVSTGGTVPGAELIGEIDPRSTTKVKTFQIQDLGCFTATLVITAWMDMDEINPNDTMMFPRGVGKVAVNMKTQEVENQETAFLPDIYLLG